MEQNQSFFQSKVKPLFTGYFRNRTVPFFIGLGSAGLSILLSILYPTLLSSISEYTSVSVTLLLVFGGIAYLLLSLYREVNLNAFALALMEFAAGLVMIATVYPYIMMQGMSEEIINGTVITLIVLLVFIFLNAILATVVAWMPLSKKPEVKKEANEEGGEKE